jgi:clan AA aspartic protease
MNLLLTGSGFSRLFRYIISSGGIAMGFVYTEVTLKNTADVTIARHGIIKESEIRQMTVQAMVDTGCFTLVINEAMRQKLGLEVDGEDVATMANETREICKVTEPVAIHWKDRHTALPALVLASAKEVLLGALPLEGMDLIVDPSRQEVTGAHGDKAVFRI